MSSMQNYPELLADLAARIGEALEACGIDTARAAEIGMMAAEHVRKNYSGQLLYLPRGHAYEKDKRDREIYARCDGRNHAELAAEYSLSVVRVYQIVKAVHANEVRRCHPAHHRPGPGAR